MQHTVFVTVTPEQAAEWLRGNTGNRNLSEGYVKIICAKIKRGRWNPSHEGIALSPSMRLLDGQHRLSAIVMSGIACPINVSFNVPEEAFRDMNRGKIRSLADNLDAKPYEVSVVCMALSVLTGTPTSTSQWQADQVNEALPAYRPFIAAIKQACGSVEKGRTTASVILAVVARMAEAKQEPVKVEILEQYRAFVLMDFKVMWPSVMALTRKVSIDRDRSVKTDPFDFMIRVWLAFDPGNRTQSRILIRNPKIRFDEISQILRDLHGGDEKVSAPKTLEAA